MKKILLTGLIGLIGITLTQASGISQEKLQLNHRKNIDLFADKIYVCTDTRMDMTATYSFNRNGLWESKDGIKGFWEETVNGLKHSVVMYHMDVPLHAKNAWSEAIVIENAGSNKEVIYIKFEGSPHLRNKCHVVEENGHL